MSLSDYSEFDSNYFIPDIEETPLSLEDILKQDDQQLNQVIDERELTLLNNACDDLEFSFLDEANQNKATSLNLSSMNYIKSQITLSKNEKINSGNPVCLTSSKNYLVVGTFCGHILVFDLSGKLKWFWKQEFDFGSIAVLSINQDESKLICGGSKGAVSLWNLNNGEMVRLMENLHAPFSSIINLKHLSDSNFAILSDTSGSVFILDVRKKDFDSNCIFTGSRGEVLTLQPLIYDDLENALDFNGIETLCLVAMATVSKVIVISVRPALFVHFTSLLKSSPEFLPILSWNFSFKLRNKIIPLLTFGRQDQLFIHKMETDFEDRINFVPLYHFKSSSYNFQNIFWIQSEAFLIVDTSENIHLIDFYTQEEVETLDISFVELVYESASFKALVNGGYVSKAMAKAGEHACTNSFALHRGPTHNLLFVLGLDSVYEISLRSWQERAEHLLESGESLSALQLIHGKYLNVRERIDSVEESTLMRDILERLEYAFECFLNFVQERGCMNSRNEARLRKLIQTFLTYGVCLESKYEKIFDLFEKVQPNSTAKHVFLESLEHYIFNNELEELNPILVNEIIAHCIEKKWYNLLDSILIHFSITSLDIDRIIKLSLEYYLYDTFIYIYNVAFRDFITPFDRLLEVLHNLIKDKIQYTKEDILLGNKLLVYLNCMLTGVYYPNKGRLSPSEEFEHLERVYKRIVASSPQTNVLSVLFKYDCTEFLNVILIAFEYLDQNHSDLLQWKQKLIDYFILKIIDDESRNFIAEQQNAFFIFLARCLISCDSITITKKNFIKMVNSLFAKDSKRFEERQQILIQLLNEKKFKHFYEQSLFLESAEKSEMYKICEFIHKQNQDWIRLFFAYIKDPTKENEIFEYINLLLSDEAFLKTPMKKIEFLNVIFDNYLLLIQIDSQKAVNIFFAHFDQSEDLFNRIISKLTCKQNVLHQFLKLTIFENRINYSKSLSNSSSSYRKIFDLCLNPHYQEKYIELVCQFESENIISTLDILQECNDLNALKVCKQFNIKEGEAYIYEKMKQFKKSFDILFEDVKREVNDVIQYCFNNLQKIPEDLHFTSVDNKFTKLLEFCKRSFKYAGEEQPEKESFFLLTLEFLIEIKITLNNIYKMKNDKLAPQFLHLITEPEKRPQVEQLIKGFNKRFKTLFEKLINLMLNNLSLVDFFGIIVKKVLQQNEDLFDVREMLLCILENYHYEKNLLELTNNMLSCEHHQLMGQFQLTNVKSQNMRQSYCGLCLHTTLAPNDHTSKVILYSCNHPFHLECIEEIRISKNVDQLLCPLCHGLEKENRSSTAQQADDEEIVNNNIADELDLLSEQQPQTQSPSKVSQADKLHLVDTQLRALNYFHQGRLKQSKRSRQS